MECALANYFNYRTNLIVPNVCWGLDIHECDLFILSQAGYATEVEIKISIGDLRADAKKRHGHRSNRIKRLYFAMPLALGNKYHAMIHELVPERAGILLVREKDDDWRQPKIIKGREAVKQRTSRFTDTERYKIARLGAIRIWPLKRKLLA
jgi:hypothetical protein